MNTHDLYLLSPEISMAGLAILLLLLDLMIPRKQYLVGVAFLGLLVPLWFSWQLWSGVDDWSSTSGNVMGIEGSLIGALVVDKFSIFFKFLFIGVTAVVILISSGYTRKFEKFQIEYYALVLFAVTGMMLLASTLELITIYISLELATLPVVALSAFLRDSRSSESGMKFLILSGISSALLLYGMVLIYGFTGTTMLEEIGVRISEMDLNGGDMFGSYALLFGVVLLIGGFGFKIAAVPFHMWAPDVYEGAPTPVTAFLSVASKAAGFAVILRVFYIAFPLEEMNVEWSAIFAVIAALSMSIGNLVAIAQSNIKRMLAYSTVAHAGYIMVGLAAVGNRNTDPDNLIGVSGVLFYLVAYAAMNLAAFSAVIAISNRTGSDRIVDFSGMGRRAPYIAAALAFALISLTGVPPTVGFMAKIYIFGAAVSNGLAWLVLIGVMNSVVSAYYYFKVVKIMYLATPDTEDSIKVQPPLRFALIITTASILIFGLYPKPLLELAKIAAAALA